MTRIYYGNIYPVRGAVFLTDGRYDYRILNIENNSQKSYRKAYIKCGFDRELEVYENAKIILQTLNSGKEKIISIPFVKEDNRLVFDLPNFFKQNKIRFKLHRRNTRDCSGQDWNDASYKIGISNKGEIGWYENWCIDYMEYYLWVEFFKKSLYIDNKPLRYLAVDRETNTMDTPDVKQWFEKLMNSEPTYVSLKDFLNSLKEIGINASNIWTSFKFWGDKNIYRVDSDENTKEPILKKSIY